MEKNTIPFLPERLNRQPVVFRGLTISEVFLSLGIGALGGLVIGILLTLVMGKWVLIPASIASNAALTLFISGKYFARIKRGKPDSYLYRAIELWFFNNGLSKARLIIKDSIWSIRRTPR